MGWGSWRKFTNDDYEPAFIGLGYVFLVSFFVFIIQIVVHSLGLVFQKKKRSTKRMKKRPVTSTKDLGTIHKSIEIEEIEEIDGNFNNSFNPLSK